MRATHTSAHTAGTTEGPVAKKPKIDGTGVCVVQYDNALNKNSYPCA